MTDPTPVTHCPVHRKTLRPSEADGAPLEHDARGVWRVRGYAEARDILRADGTTQAGFRAEQVAQLPGGMRAPILYQEGDEHRLQRTQIARFFTPATTSQKHRPFMERYADEIIAELKQQRQADLSALSMKLAVQVAAQVIGLTSSRRPGMAARIEAFFDQEDAAGLRGAAKLRSLVKNQWRLAKFYFMDVRPAILARKKAPQEDVISHLIAKGYSGPEILTECVTYGAAGMATTREFISVAAWHLLEQPDLREEYLKAGEKERHRLLHELLRLEPVVGHLYRRAQRDLTVESDGQTHTIPAGALIDLSIYGANSDERAVGPDGERACPHREVAAGVQPYALSFGDGHHRCPGAFIAIHESDIFLTRLLSLPNLTVIKPPTLSFNDLVAGYELRDFIVTV